MKNKILTILLFSGILFVAACLKNDDEDCQTFKYSYIINLQNDKLISYSIYEQNTNSLLEEVTYYYLNDQIIEIKIMNGVMVSKHVYHTANGLTTESYDTIFRNDTVTDLYYHKYDHSNERLDLKETEYKHLTAEITEIFNLTTRFTYSDAANIIEQSNTVNTGGGGFTCKDRFSYSGKQSKFDVINFNSEITGEISNNLREQATYNTGCPAGPSYTFPTSTFNYEINDAGYVIYMTKSYSSDESISSVTKSSFEYNFK
jgi:hypothetical protein